MRAMRSHMSPTFACLLVWPSSRLPLATIQRAGVPACVVPKEMLLGSCAGGDELHAAHVGMQRGGHVDAAIGALVILHDRDKRAADGEARAVQRMHELGLALCISVARLHPPRLKRLAVAARADLAVRVLRRQPHLEIVRLRAGEAYVGRAQRD